MRLLGRSALLASFLTVALAAVPVSAAKARMKKLYDPKAQPISSGALMQGGGQGHLSQAQYDVLKYAAKEVLKRFPPKDHYYIGIGRSPSFLVAMLQNLTSDEVSSEEVAMNFPASGLHDGGAHDDASYFRHLDALVPKEVLTGNRTIVLLDRSRPFNGNAASGGASLQMMKGILERYLAQKGSKVKVAAAGFAYGALNPAFQVTHIAFDNRTQNELERVSMPYYEAVAEWPQHRITPTAQIPSRRNDYQTYKKFLKERMIRDSELDTFLDKHISSELHVLTKEEQEAELKLQAEQLKKEQALLLKEKEALVKTAQAFPAKMKKDLTALINQLSVHEDTEKHPYFSPNATQLNAWLQQAFKDQAAAGQLAPEVTAAGPNLVVRTFVDAVEQARIANKIRNRDYRRLVGHAMSAANMDKALVAYFVKLYGASKYLRRELTEETDYYLEGHSKKDPNETVNMAANFKILQASLPAPPAE
jgi:hypothetical protein